MKVNKFVRETPIDEIEQELGNIHDIKEEKKQVIKTKEQIEQSFRDNFFKNYKELTGFDANEEVFESFKEYWNTPMPRYHSPSIFNFIEYIKDGN